MEGRTLEGHTMMVLRTSATPTTVRLQQWTPVAAKILATGARTIASTPQCEFDIGHSGAHSHELDAAAHPRRPGLTARNRTRDVANVVAAVEGDLTNTLEPLWTTHNAYTVAIAGDAPDAVVVSYNVDAPGSGDGVPRSTAEALNGPRGDEWLAAYQKDLQAKIKNDTFELVPRPDNRTNVLKTKVAHAHKY